MSDNPLDRFSIRIRPSTTSHGYDWSVFEYGNGRYDDREEGWYVAADRNSTWGLLGLEGHKRTYAKASAAAIDGVFAHLRIDIEEQLAEAFHAAGDVIVDLGTSPL